MREVADKKRPKDSRKVTINGKTFHDKDWSPQAIARSMGRKSLTERLKRQEEMEQSQADIEAKRRDKELWERQHGS